MTTDSTPTTATGRGLWQWVLVAIILLGVAGIRFRLREIPLERDEGEYAYMGQLMLQGIPPYKLAYNMKLPGTSVAYAALMAVFGETGTGVHLGLLVVNAAAIVLMFLLGRRLFGASAGVMAAAAYGVMSLSPRVMGLSAHATHFVVLFALGATLCLLQAATTGRRRWYFWSGLLYGVAFLMKQQGMFFGVFGALWIGWEAWRKRPVDVRQLLQRAGSYMLGCALPFLLTCLVLWQAGVFKVFWFWIFDYARAYVSEVPASAGLMLLTDQTAVMAAGFGVVMAAALGGGIALWWRRPPAGHAGFVTGFFFCSFLTVCPGLYFRDHYFITLLPAMALLAGAAMMRVEERLAQRPTAARRLVLAVGVLAVAVAVVNDRTIYFSLTPLQAGRVIHKFGPFPESQVIGKYVREHTNKEARVAVLGSEPQIYFYAQRHSATGFIYTYGLVEDQPFARGMQEQMIREIEAVKPEYMVYVDLENSWMTRPNAPRLIFDWLDQYCKANYDLVGVVDMVSLTETDYHWDAAARSAPRRTPRNVFIVKRRPNL